MDLRALKKRTLCLLLTLALAGCASPPPPEEPPPSSPPPVETGYRPTGENNPNVPRNDYDEACFLPLGGFIIYTGGGAASHIGVDVSAHQGEVDWAQVRASGVEFAMLRAGLHGYGVNVDVIVEDQYFQANIEGALAAGLKVGVYFFSQAINAEEAAEEARAVLEWIEPYEITYPVAFDWENIPHAQARTDGVEPETVTECAKTFCKIIRDAGYTAMLYSNRNQTYQVIDLEQLGEYQFWLASYHTVPDFPYRFQMWQYGTGTVPGIATEVDLNLCLVDYPLEPETEPAPEAEAEQ